MTYACIANGVVTNIMELHPKNAADFPGAVPLNGVPAGMGDTYQNQAFYRNGEKLLSYSELFSQQVQMRTAAELELTEVEIALMEAEISLTEYEIAEWEGA